MKQRIQGTNVNESIKDVKTHIENEGGFSPSILPILW